MGGGFILIGIIGIVVIFAVILLSYVLLNESDYVVFFWYFVAAFLLLMSFSITGSDGNGIFNLGLFVGISAFAVSCKS